MHNESLPVSCLGSVYIGSKLSEVTLAVNSLIAGRQPDQIIIVVDGRITSDLSDFLREYTTKNIIECVYLSKNKGLGLALREGLYCCKNEIVIRFDTDDLNTPNRLEVIYKALIDHPQVDIIGSYVNEFKPINANQALMCLKKVPLTHVAITKSLMLRNSMNHPSIGFRRSAILSIGSYQDMPFFEDYYLWLRARKFGLHFLNLNEPLVYMRRTDAVKRRSGWQYFINEIDFLWICIREKLIHPMYAFLFVPRLLTRMLPSRLQILQDYLPWRSRHLMHKNPDKYIMHK